MHPATWEDVPRLLDGAKLLINASSLGMKGQPELKIDLSPMAKDAVVADIVYVPLKTKLLEAAEQRGFKTSDGLDMLLLPGRARLHPVVRHEAGGHQGAARHAGRRRDEVDLIPVIPERAPARIRDLWRGSHVAAGPG